MTDYLAIPPAREVKGMVVAPPSKSATNRALLLAALSPTPVEIVRPLDSEDTRALSRCLVAMGASIAPSEHGLLVGGPLSAASAREIPLDAGESGTAARFLAALCAAVPGRFLLTGSLRLRERPMEELLSALRSAGAEIQCTGRQGHLPASIRGGKLSPGGRVTVDASRSSQFLSALLLAGAAIGELEVAASGAVASAPYVAVTRESLSAFGHQVGEGPGGSIRVAAGRRPPARYEVPGDYSSALPLLASAGMAGGDVVVEGLDWPSPQADALALPVLESLGISIETGPNSIRARAARKLSPVTVRASDCPDAVPSLAALASLAPGKSRFLGVAHLALKESDRIASVTALLRAAGAQGGEENGDLVVEGPPRPRGGPIVLPVSGDHRIAMAGALLALALPDCLVENPGCVAKSYPRFFRDLESLATR